MKRNAPITRGLGTVAVLCLFVFVTGVRISSTRRRGSGQQNQDCVSVPTANTYRRTVSDVFTCDAGDRLQSDLEDLEDELEALEQATKEALNAQQAAIEALRAEVLRLQGVGRDPLQPVLFDLPTTPNFTGEARRLCEIYTMGEACVICREFGFPDNPNVHFTHVPCGDDCPDRTWKYEPGCARINTPFPQVLLDCFYDPLLRNETCTSPVFLACEGYTNTFSDQFKVMVV